MSTHDPLRNILNSDISRFRKRLLPEGDCLIWQGAVNTSGYGVIGINWGMQFTHRLAWMLHHRKPIPKGMMVCHTCDTPRCCNPAHLFLGTAYENVQDMIRKARQGVCRKIAPELEPLIRARIEAGETHASIAVSLGVERSTVTRFLQRLNRT